MVYLGPCPGGVPWCMTTTWSTTYVVEKCDVMWKLPHPVLTGGSERQLRKLTFGIDLSNYIVVVEIFHNCKSSLQIIRIEKRKERAENVKIDFQNKVPDVVTLHSDGKLLPALSARKSKDEGLPIVTSYGLKEQLIAVQRLDNSTGKEQADAFRKAILDWNLEDKVQILSCDTTASNTGHFNGACALL
ncbi:hypothetical protein AVEN_265375-1 [Araneus ventricosus]|uniref:Uncharacterized protein n=1 Tax=Araneus ventricosus TaxID=182803 RepID=A0A4Y2IT71_ARAVE|nr:hypothetical protein AVEN_265375-1 [Araneus ventricosus]